MTKKSNGSNVGVGNCKVSLKIGGVALTGVVVAGLVSGCVASSYNKKDVTLDTSVPAVGYKAKSGNIAFIDPTGDGIDVKVDDKAFDKVSDISSLVSGRTVTQIADSETGAVIGYEVKIGPTGSRLRISQNAEGDYEAKIFDPISGTGGNGGGSDGGSGGAGGSGGGAD